MQIFQNILPSRSQTAEGQVRSDAEEKQKEQNTYQTDLLKDQRRFKKNVGFYSSRKERAGEFNAGNEKTENRENSRRAILNTYLELRLFNNEFPDDARRLETYKIYNSKGRQSSFSFAGAEHMGSTIDIFV